VFPAHLVYDRCLDFVRPGPPAVPSFLTGEDSEERRLVRAVPRRLRVAVDAGRDDLSACCSATSRASDRRPNGRAPGRSGCICAAFAAVPQCSRQPICRVMAGRGRTFPCHGRPCACHPDRKGKHLSNRDGRDGAQDGARP